MLSEEDLVDFHFKITGINPGEVKNVVSQFEQLKIQNEFMNYELYKDRYGKCHEVEFLADLAESKIDEEVVSGKPIRFEKESQFLTFIFGISKETKLNAKEFVML